MEVVRGELKIVESKVFSSANNELFLSADSAGAIRVFQGTFKSFNRWENESDYGTLDEQDPDLLKINAAKNADDSKMK